MDATLQASSAGVGSVFLGRYEIVSELGRGAFGRVFLARRTDNGSSVVVKLLHEHHAHNDTVRRLFLREMQAMARFRHPYVVELYEVEADGPMAGIVMEYVRGATLEVVLQRSQRLPLERVVRFVTQLCYALEAAHKAGLVHRDLKPENLMVVSPGSPRESLKVMDFGLAQSLNARPHFSAEMLKGIAVAHAAGTPAYIAPELVRGEGSDHRCDLYSIGVIIYELLTGRLPFDDDDPDLLVARHVKHAPPWFADAGAPNVVPREVEDLVVYRLLAKYPVERPQSARELAAEFAAAARMTMEPAPAAVEQTNRAISGVPKESNYFNNVKTKSGSIPFSYTQTFVAWMPEPIAVIKLQGFVKDAGGELAETAPGLMRIHFDLPPPPEPEAKGVRKLLQSISRRARGSEKPSAPPPDPIELLLFMEKLGGEANRLQMTVRFVPIAAYGVKDLKKWRARAEKIATELRGYLMA